MAKKTLSGVDSLRYCLSELSGVKESDLPTDTSIYWFDQYRKVLGDAGYTLTTEHKTVPVEGKHIGLFQRDGEIQAAIFDGNDLVDNPTDFRTLNASVLSSRLKVEKAKSKKEAQEDAESRRANPADTGSDESDASGDDTGDKE